MKAWLLLFACTLPLGCTATCLRDSDCMGASMCTDNRCILIDGADAGRRTTTTDTTDDSVAPEESSSEPSNDAGSN